MHVQCNADLLISGQLFQNVTSEHPNGSARKQIENQLTLLVRKEFLNDTVTLEVLSIMGLNDADGLMQADLDYQLTGNVELSVGFDLFYRTAAGIFGQFNQRDRLTLGIQIGL